MNFIDKKVSVKQAITILAKNGIQVDDEETAVILDFLYFMAKNYKKTEEGRTSETPKRNRTPGKMQ
ncbi:MAG: PTS sugar transporter subunit IIBC [Moheibacter sp.]